MKLGAPWKDFKAHLRQHPAGGVGQPTADDVIRMQDPDESVAANATFEISVRCAQERRQARNARKRARTKRAALMRNGTEQNARRAETVARRASAKDLRRVIRKAVKGEGISKRLRPQIARMQALAGATPDDRARALLGRT